jgi:hypothetical protein
MMMGIGLEQLSPHEFVAEPPFLWLKTSWQSHHFWWLNHYFCWLNHHIYQFLVVKWLNHHFWRLNHHFWWLIHHLHVTQSPFTPGPSPPSVDLEKPQQRP